MIENKEIAKFSNELFPGIVQLIEQARQKVSLVLNGETTLLNWNIGHYINENLKINNRLEYGGKILVTLSQQLTSYFGKGYSYSALTRMCKVANCVDVKNIATLSQHLSWSHLIEIASISDELKREYYTLLAIQNHWGVRQLRGQMELYLRWLEKYEMQEGEEKPIGLLLCSEGNTVPIELLMLHEPDIKVAHYLTELPDKQWFADKLRKARELAGMINPKDEQQ